MYTHLLMKKMCVGSYFSLFRGSVGQTINVCPFLCHLRRSSLSTMTYLLILLHKIYDFILLHFNTRVFSEEEIFNNLEQNIRLSLMFPCNYNFFINSHILLFTIPVTYFRSVIFPSTFYTNFHFHYLSTIYKHHAYVQPCISILSRGTVPQALKSDIFREDI